MIVSRDPTENEEARLLRRPGEERDGRDVEQFPLPPSLLLLGVQHVLHQLNLILPVAFGGRQQHLGMHKSRLCGNRETNEHWGLQKLGAVLQLLAELEKRDASPANWRGNFLTMLHFTRATGFTLFWAESVRPAVEKQKQWDERGI